MGAAFVILAVVEALLALWGALMLWQAIFAWWFLPVSIGCVVVVEKESDIDDLDFLLCEAEKHCVCHKDRRPVVLLTPDMVKIWVEKSNTPQTDQSISPDVVLDSHGAVMFVGDFLDR